MTATQTDFKCHGYYSLTNLGGYEIELHRSGESARVKDPDGTISDWLAIEYISDEAGEQHPVIDAKGRFIELSNVMRA